MMHREQTGMAGPRMRFGRRAVLRRSGSRRAMIGLASVLFGVLCAASAEADRTDPPGASEGAPAVAIASPIQDLLVLPAPERVPTAAEQAE